MVLTPALFTQMDDRLQRLYEVVGDQQNSELAAFSFAGWLKTGLMRRLLQLTLRPGGARIMTITLARHWAACRNATHAERNHTSQQLHESRE